jgi:hypothetical protein
MTLTLSDKHTDRVKNKPEKQSGWEATLGRKGSCEKDEFLVKLRRCKLEKLSIYGCCNLSIPAENVPVKFAMSPRACSGFIYVSYPGKE